MASALGFLDVQSINCVSRFSYPSLNSNLYPISLQSSALSCSFSPNNVYYRMKLKHPTRASAEGVGVPSELIEDSKFVPLEADEPRYGPPALLLLGFEIEEASKVYQLLKELDGEFMEVIYCTEDMINRSLREAMNTRQTNLEAVKIAKSLPRICFLSGLSGEEMMMFIDAFPETGLEPAAFAALVPNSADKPLQELMEEIMGDHEMLTGKNKARVSYKGRLTPQWQRRAGTDLI